MMSLFEAETSLRSPIRFEPDPLPQTAGGSGFARSEETAASGSGDHLSETPEELARRSYQEGLRAGRAELPWKEADQLRTAVAALEQAARELDATRRGYLLANRRIVLDLAVALAEKVLARELQTDPQTLASVVERALQCLEPEGPVEVYLSCRDLQHLEQGSQEALTSLLQGRHIRIIPGSDLRPGEVRVAAESGEVDARVAAVLERAREELDEALGTVEAGDDG